MLILLAALTSVWNIQDPVWTGLGVNPSSWSNTPVSCMAAPAGLSRLESLHIETAIGLRNGGQNWSVAGGMPLGEGRFSAGAGAGWEGDTERGTVQLSAGYVVTGDPIGFMEGLFGPSISTGASASVTYMDSTRSTDVSFDCGFQFSLFPSFALGMNVSDVAGDPVLRSGFSHVFNRSLKLHLNHGDGLWQAGAELTASPALKLYSGTDGHSLNAGFSYSTGSWTGGYGAVFLEESIVHTFGVSRRLP
jgi:hypothetical protein